MPRNVCLLRSVTKRLVVMASVVMLWPQIDAAFHAGCSTFAHTLAGSYYGAKNHGNEIVFFLLYYQ